MKDLNSTHTIEPCEKKSTAAGSLLSAAARRAILTALSADFPNPQSELIYRNPFELLCAVVLSAQATDVSVNKVSPALFAAAPAPAAMAALGEEGIAPYIKSIGLWRAKAKNLAGLARMLLEDFGGEVPQSEDALLKLPGVGSKTAKVVMNAAFGAPVIAVDTHVFRVCSRTGFCLGRDAREVEARIVPLVPEEYRRHAHHYLLLHGRYVCRAQKPDCKNCSIAAWCLKREVRRG